MSNKNLSLNKENWKKLDELMKQTNKSTRQAAMAEVLNKAGKWDIEDYELLGRFSELSANHVKLQDAIKLYRISFVVLVIVAIAGWVL